MDLYRYYMDGPGEVLITTLDYDPAAPDYDKIVAVATCKSASFRSSVTQEPVTGGRSLVPKRKFLTDRSMTFEMQDCEMDFRYLSISQGEDTVKGVTTVWAFGDDEKYTIPAGGGVVTLHHVPLTGTLAVVYADTGTVFTSGTAAAGVYSQASDALTFAVADGGKVIKAMYQYDSEDTAVTVSTKQTSIPDMVKIIHKQPTFDANNVETGTQFIEIFKAQGGNDFEMAFTEKAAFAPTLTFDVLDPERADKKIVDYKLV